MLNTIWFLFDLIRFRKDFSLCTWKITTNRSIQLSESDVSQHHGGSVDNSFKPLRPSQHYCIERLKKNPQLGLIMAKDLSLSDNRFNFFSVWCSVRNWWKMFTLCMYCFACFSLKCFAVELNLPHVYNYILYTQNSLDIFCSLDIVLKLFHTFPLGRYTLRKEMSQ